MNISLLKKHIESYMKNLSSDPDKHKRDWSEREERMAYYQSFTKNKLINMSEEIFYEYIAKLWAMLIWGNKKYAIDKIIQKNGFEKVKSELADLVWGTDTIENRWNHFKKNVIGFGPAMISEILCYVHPNKCLIWNRRAYVGFDYLGIRNLPRYNYQMTGKKYSELSEIAKSIAKELNEYGMKKANLLTVDYFIWDELQVAENLSNIGKKVESPDIEKIDHETSKFIHNEIRDKLADIGKWLGFNSQTEIKVAEGSKVDTIWESTIGNMGRIIYVFEVQTKGNIDSLIVNLLKALNNPAVQGVVAVSDAEQLGIIKKHAMPVGDLDKKLKYWDYKEVLKIHESLEMVNESINSLGLVPQGFYKV